MGVSTHMHTPPKSEKKAIQLKKKDIKEGILIYSNTTIVVLVRNSEVKKNGRKKE